jgi:hypothetical protein
MTGMGIAALSPDKRGVWYLGREIAGEGWHQLGDVTPRNRLFGGASGLLAEYPDGDVYFYNVRDNGWERLRGPGADFVSTSAAVFGLTPKGEAIWSCAPSVAGAQWTEVGGASKAILASSNDLYSLDPQFGNLWELPGGDPSKAQWRQIGGPGASFAAGLTSIIGLTPTRAAVFYFASRDNPPQWNQVGGPAADVFADYSDFWYTISPDWQSISRWDGDTWVNIGPGGAFPLAGAQIAVSYSPSVLTADRQAVWNYLYGGQGWVKVGGPADSIVATNLSIDRNQ